MSGQWPPEWQDPDWEDSDAGLPDEWTADEAELGQDASLVASFLSSTPSPVLPAAFEARISAAIAAEASARADGVVSAAAASTAAAPTGTEVEPVAAEPVDPWTASAAADDAKTTDRSISPELSPTTAESGAATAARHRRRRASAGSGRAAGNSGPAGSRPGGRRRRFRMPSPAVGGPLVVLLIIAGFALVFANLGGSSATYSGTSGLASGVTASSAASAGTRTAEGGAFGASAPEHESNQSATNTQRLAFSVTESGTSFHQATLVTQVREQLNGLFGPGATPAASSSASTSASAPVPSAVSSASGTSPATVKAQPALAGCVSRVTDGVTPTLVDKGTYDGIPAYVIAIPSHVWVVKLGCTAADPMQITSASLSG